MALPSIRARAARRAVLFHALLATVALAGCPESHGSRNREKAPPKGCTKAYEQCELGPGLLGVCDRVDCPPGTPEPCLRCRSQH